ncbi:hypothetical protein L0668_01815 [Paraglaciecola aquimarina]|uniref:Gluconolaconase n=1 Tax=Paraglaciecola algarum TaxID=3050085 RepID=A0ABS9D1M0_9ALTE|nr:hypothetical protein [Paraglaciecola sp. G1-23]MCF2946828.1 hypothetical protein [Paraglaciecola sp. G1-23]
MPMFTAKLAQYLLTLVILFFANNTIAHITFPVDIGERPESITKGFDGDYFVSVMNKKVPKDGVIVRLGEHGEISTFASGFDEPKGLAFINNHLYVTDVTKVWKIDNNGKALIFADSPAFPLQTLYLNDISPNAGNTGMYVTEMGAVSYMRDDTGSLWPLNSDEAKKIPTKGRVYHIDLKGKVTEAVAASKDLLNPNGVGLANNGDILISGFFLGKVFTHNQAGLTILSQTFRGADAIEQGNNGHYYLSSWTQGKVWQLHKDTLAPKVLLQGLQSAADFYLDEENKRLLVPDMLAGTINQVKLEK